MGGCAYLILEHREGFSKEISFEINHSFIHSFAHLSIDSSIKHLSADFVRSHLGWQFWALGRVVQEQRPE